MAKKTSNQDYYQIKLTLMASPLPIWRRLLINPVLTMNLVHDVFQIAMGWWDYHLYDFEIGKRHFGDIETAEGDPKVEDACEFTLGEVLKKPGDAGLYTYDFGDNWCHKFSLEQTVKLPKYKEPFLAKCLHGRRANPPEDCGGITGFTNLIEAIEDPLHPDRKDQLAWLESDYNPESFDSRIVNLRLALLEQQVLEESEALRFFEDLKDGKISLDKGITPLKIVRPPE